MNYSDCTLLIDADDTLWENNIFYEEAVRDFSLLLAREGLLNDCAEEVVREREMSNVKRFGYGSESLYRTMLEIVHDLCAQRGKAAEHHMLDWVAQACRRTGDYEIILLDGVRETLPLLKARNRLILLTKGNELEQASKIERSGLRHHFHSTRIVAEKHVETYCAIVDEFNLSAERTWMVGNSPRSDINPAKAAGLGTVLIPYHTTWVHEMEEVSREGRETLMLKSFAELVSYFC
jgi:putative hydrolase of the HAD superfamily